MSRWPDPWWRCPANMIALALTCIVVAVVLALSG